MCCDSVRKFFVSSFVVVDENTRKITVNTEKTHWLLVVVVVHGNFPTQMGLRGIQQSRKCEKHYKFHIENSFCFNFQDFIVSRLNAP